jgi:predicted secreted hydrolase
MGQEEPTSEWRRATAHRSWIFPKDHGSHPEFRTEWWYFTGNLHGSQGRRYGYQLTFFRQGVRPKAANPDSPWSLRDVYFAHFTVTDISEGSFMTAERVSRTGPGLAGARTDGMDVWVLSWSAKMNASSIFLEAESVEMALRLELRPRKPLVLQGQNGLSKKGSSAGQASHYYSYTHLETSGHLRTKPGGQEEAVRGVSWFDHEFGSNQLAPDQVGWDWFGLHLSDGRDLMIYLLRRSDGSIEPASSGTLVEPLGMTHHLGISDLHVSVLKRWQSLRTGGHYPSRWRLRIPSAGIDLDLVALFNDQELDTKETTRVVYWEGAVGGKGLSAGKEISCEGYAELTGYAGSLGGMF